MLKRLDSRYSPGERTGAWLKVKNVGRQEFVIGGWQPGEGRRRDLTELMDRLRPLTRKTNPFAARRGPRKANTSSRLW